ncbi:MAG: hypothetical protein KAS25_05010 [Dehalococcoidales bacterium]|nr:hypothetical protein [Dehalococcoidales bacterium]
MSGESKENNEEDTRQAKREEKKRKEKARIRKHGKGLGRIYRDAIEKRKKEKGE